MRKEGFVRKPNGGTIRERNEVEGPRTRERIKVYGWVSVNEQMSPREG